MKAKLCNFYCEFCLLIGSLDNTNLKSYQVSYYRSCPQLLTLAWKISDTSLTLWKITNFPIFCFIIIIFFQFPWLFQTFPDYSVSVATVFYVQNIAIKKLSCYCHKQYLLEGALHLASFLPFTPPLPPTLSRNTPKHRFPRTEISQSNLFSANHHLPTS